MKITFIKTKTGKRLKENEKSKNIFNRNKKKDRNVVSIDNNRRMISKIKKVDDNHKENNEKIMEGLKVIFKRNQLVLLTVALMLITAGYMNYNNSNNDMDITLAELGDAKLVSANITENEESIENKVNEENVENKMNEENVTNEVKETSGEKIEEKNELSEVNVGENSLETSGNTVQENINTEQKVDVKNDNYFVQTRLERETMYSQMLETYEKILENEKIPADQKSIASNEIKNINDKKSAISIVENLIKTKGFEETVVLINDNNIDVIVKSDKNLETEQVAQITNIVSRELKSNIEDIHISIHK